MRRTQLGLMRAVPELAREPEVLSLPSGGLQSITDTLAALLLVLVNFREIKMSVTSSLAAGTRHSNSWGQLTCNQLR